MSELNKKIAIILLLVLDFCILAGTAIVLFNYLPGVLAVLFSGGYGVFIGICTKQVIDLILSN